MRVKEEWKQTVSHVDAWKAILSAVVLIAGIIAFEQTLSHSRFERLMWAAALLFVWIMAAKQTLKYGWRIWQSFQSLFLMSYTFLVGSDLFPHGAVTLWRTNIGALLMIGALGDAIFDFNKSRKPVSTDTADATE